MRQSKIELINKILKSCKDVPYFQKELFSYSIIEDEFLKFLDDEMKCILKEELTKAICYNTFFYREKAQLYINRFCSSNTDITPKEVSVNIKNLALGVGMPLAKVTTLVDRVIESCERLLKESCTELIEIIANTVKVMYNRELSISYSQTLTDKPLILLDSILNSLK